MLKRFKREMLERSRMKMSNEGKVTKIEPNVLVDGLDGVTRINKNLYEYKIDLINTIMKKVDPQADLIPYNYDITNEQFTALMNKVLQTTVQLSDAE
jgi:hypothetical protein